MISHSGPDTLRNPEEAWRFLFKTYPQPALVTDENTVIVEANSALTDTFALAESHEVAATDVFKILRPLNLSEDEIRSSLHDLSTGVFHFDCNVRVGSGRDLYFKASVVRALEGKVPSPLIWYFTDVTEQRYSERLLDFLGVKLNCFDAISAGGEAAEMVVKIAVPELANGCRVEILANGDLQLIAAAHAETGGSDPSPLEAIRTGVSRLCDRSICVPVRVGEDVAGTISMARDAGRSIFTSVDLLIVEELAAKLGACVERERMRAKLDEMRIAAEEANRAKTHFLANVSHEIRTPLTAILGFSELLTSTQTSEVDRKVWISRIRRNGDHLLRIIDDVLDLSKIEVGKLETQICRIDLNYLLSEVDAVHSFRARNKGVGFTIEIEGEVPAEVFSDETRLFQILCNLTGNALKFTSNGEVRLKVSYQADESGEAAPDCKLLRFVVEDTGIGLSDGDSLRLFQPFTQADSSHTREFGGTGLGLALSKRIAQRLGGDLVLLYSRPGEGSAFMATIDPGPVSELAPSRRLNFGMKTEAVAPCVRDGLTGLRILLVDDSADNRFLFSTILSGAGAAVELAEDGDEAIEKANKENFDVILMDIQMPGKDGYQATSELRAGGYLGPICALSAHAMNEEKEKCLASGCDMYITKPIQKAELIRQIQEIVRT